jgi:thiosulfate reductase cytochrome b subunit
MSRLSSLALLPLAFLVSSTSHAQQPVNPMHPAFAPLDASGAKVRTAAEVSFDKTCGSCHDAQWIGEHSGHLSRKVQATCAQCHLDGGRLDVREETLDQDGRLVRGALRIGAPRPENCGSCHGVVSSGVGPVVMPPDFEDGARTAGRNFSLTEGEGAVVSPSRMSDSFLNLEGKSTLGQAWDVHAAKMVDCAACHFAANNPTRTSSKRASLSYLTDDPRRLSSAEFLQRPDHRLAEQSCRGCHDARQAHDFLPYRERHLEVLACQTCHVAEPRGPALEMEDATVMTVSSTPARRYRNVSRQPGEALNAATITSFRPLLTERVDADGVKRLSPVNTVSRFHWISTVDKSDVPWAKVVEAFKDGSGYSKAIADAFDANHDGRIDVQELRLDSKAKVDLVASRLKAAGVAEPAIDGTLETFPVAHGVPSRERALRNCEECHSGGSRLSGRHVIAGYLPGGVLPKPREDTRVDLSGQLSTTSDGSLVLERSGDVAPGGLQVLGHSRQRVIDTLGLVVFSLTFLAVAGHALLRWILRRRRAQQPVAEGERAYLFGRYERIWHWTMALSGVLLIVTGLEIRNPGAHWLMQLPQAVAVHNVFAGVLMLNAFLALFYHLATRAIANFIPEPKGMLARVLAHVNYQSRGIFYGGAHPANAPGHKLNPLQQLTYLALLNVLFPLQIGTGVLLWAAGHSPAVAAALGGLAVVAPLHNAGSWLFLTFFVVHVYLVSTGRTLTDHLTSMITGYGAADDHAPTGRS